jgi:hypothetical protein
VALGTASHHHASAVGERECARVRARKGERERSLVDNQEVTEGR